MSTRIYPCFRCPLRIGCEQHAEFKRRAKDVGARSIAFDCSRLGGELRPGRRVVIRQPFQRPYQQHDGSYDGEYSIEHREVSATVTSIARRGYRFAAVVDPGSGEFENEKFRFRRKQPHFRVVRFLDEPDAELCTQGNVRRGGKCDALNECTCEQFREAATQ